MSIILLKILFLFKNKNLKKISRKLTVFDLIMKKSYSRKISLRKKKYIFTKNALKASKILEELTFNFIILHYL
ncbi:hypothetical protein BpHYR1_012732 [Brachionus plicatilis]|uniref:Uncharacterized protein n=1 Tax=Brachionus plicatilis TaxID=10195 RepID=A0A3M7T252_BRAPC|nr:hypothetical protein BpHYR1_012732 [Brachionus plicatilis]